MKFASFTAIAATFVLAACQPTPSAQQTQQVAPTPVTVAAPSGSMMSLLNGARASGGLGAVRENPRLSQAAQAHAQDMVQNDYFSHRGQNGSSFTERARAAGYACALAENIAFGQRTEAAVMEAWMTSAGHRRNILQRDAVEYGIGQSGTKWVLIMGRGC